MHPAAGTRTNETSKNDLRRRLFEALEPSEHHGPGLSRLNRFIVGIIVLSVAFAVIESEHDFYDQSPEVFHWIEFAFSSATTSFHSATLWS